MSERVDALVAALREDMAAFKCDTRRWVGLQPGTIIDLVDARLPFIIGAAEFDAMEKARQAVMGLPSVDRDAVMVVLASVSE